MRGMTAKVDYGSANTSNEHEWTLCLNAMWHWHNGRRAERENESKERVERVRQTAEGETCKFGGHESLHLLKDFDPNDGIEGEEREWVAHALSFCFM